MATFNGQPAASADDAQESSGTVTLTGALNANGSAQYIGLRFPNVTIPQGATINSAIITANLTSGSFDDPDVTIYCQAADDAAQFTTSSNDISARPLTTANVVWTQNNVGTGSRALPDIAAAIQEVINRPGWVSGNAIVVIIKGNSGSSSFRISSYDTGTPATIAIDYTPDTGQDLEGAFVSSTLTVWPGEVMHSALLTVADGGDDGHEAADGTVSLATSFLNCTPSIPVMTLVFRNVPLAPGDTVNIARPMLFVDITGSFNTWNVTWRAQRLTADLAATSHNLSGRDMTDANVVWNEEYDENTGEIWIEGPNLAAVVQEVIDGGGWNEGDDIALFALYNSGEGFGATSRDATYDHPQFFLGWTPGLTQTLEGAFVASTLTIYPGDVTAVKELTGAFVSSTLIIYAGEVTARKELEGAFIASTLTIWPGQVKLPPQELEGAFIASTLEIWPGAIEPPVAELDGVYVESTLTLWPGRVMKTYGDIVIASVTHFEDEDINSASFWHETPEGDSRALVVIATYYDAIGVTLAKWGEEGEGDGEFKYPQDIAVDGDGNVYVIDAFPGRIRKFTSDGAFITKWGGDGDGDGEFWSPLGIATDSAGNVYVSDGDDDENGINNRIQKFTSNGEFITKWGSYGNGNTQFDSPAGIAVDADDNVYVVDFGNHCIKKFDSNGSFILRWGSFGFGNGNFNYPRGIAVDRDGYVYVADSANDRIQKFTSDGTFVTKWGGAGSANGQFNLPTGIAVDSVGNLYVADFYNSRIQKFTSDGKFIAKFGSYGSGDGQFISVGNVAVGNDGNIYALDYQNHRVQKFAPSFAPVAPYYGSDQLTAIQYIDSGPYFQGIYLLKAPPVGLHEVAFGPSGEPAILMMTAISFNDIELALTDYTAPDANIGKGQEGSSTVLYTSHDRTYEDNTLTLWSVLYETDTPVTYTPQTGNEVVATRNMGDLYYTMGLRYEETGTTGSRTFGATASDSVSRKSIIFIHLEQARAIPLFGAFIEPTTEIYAGEVTAVKELDGAFIDSTLTIYAGEIEQAPGQTQYLTGVFIGMGMATTLSGAYIASTLTLWPGAIETVYELEGAFAPSTLEIWPGAMIAHESTITARIWPGEIVLEEI